MTDKRQTAFWFTPKERKLLEALAKHHGWTMATVIREGIRLLAKQDGIKIK
jgi:predicted DNA-binding protein